MPLLFRGTVKFKSYRRILNIFSKDIYSIDQTLPRVGLRACTTVMFDPY